MRIEQGVKIFNLQSRKLPSNCYFIQESGSYKFPYHIKIQRIDGTYLTASAATDEYTAIKIAKLLNEDLKRGDV